jgi:nitroreductase
MEIETKTLKGIIEKRRSIFPKDYTGEEIPQDILDEILSSANFAPNHKKTKPWRFRVFRGEEKEILAKTIAETYKKTTPPQLFLEKKYLDFGNKISKADTIFTISVNFSGLVPEWEEIAATAMAVQNMYLTCTANNVGCYWSSHKVTEHLSEFLELEENQKCLGLFYMGMTGV